MYHMSNQERIANLARAMVAIEIPVEPTVPSKMREPVCGRR